MRDVFLAAPIQFLKERFSNRGDAEHVQVLIRLAIVSTAMFLGEGGAAAVAAIYLWVTLGNGFR